ncbi:MAG: hypothetical protein U0893_22615 [Chloroflexota bacterium]
MGEAASALFAFGQQVLQQQQGGDQPTVCFAMVPLLIPAAFIVLTTVGRKIRRFAGRPA